MRACSHVSWIWILVKPAWALRLSTSWKFFERHLLWSPRVAENRVGWGTRLKGLKLECLRVDEAHLGVIFSFFFLPSVQTRGGKPTFAGPCSILLSFEIRQRCVLRVWPMLARFCVVRRSWRGLDLRESYVTIVLMGWLAAL